MSVHYVVAFYLGDRLTQSCNSLIKADRYHYVKTHIERLNRLNLPSITKATFVISEYNTEIDAGVQEIVDQSNSVIPISVLYRKNWGGSYGAWNEAITKELEGGYDYHFLIEDDYVPACDEFYQPFIDKFKDNTAYVCQWWNDGHAAISNGMFSNKVAIEIQKKKKQIFNIDLKRNDWHGFVQNQVTFLQNAKDLGYKFDDCARGFLHPFLERHDYISFFGKRTGNVLIEPESTVDWKLSNERRHGMWMKSGFTEDEVLRLNKIRNAKATSTAKDARVFNDREAIEFFENNPENIYILYDCDIKEGDDLIGYVRYKMLDEKTMQISPKIKFYYDNRKTYFGHIHECMLKLAEEHKVDKFVCELAQANVPMINAMKETMGFNEETRHKNAIIRKGIPEDLIVLVANCQPKEPIANKYQKFNKRKKS